MSFRLAPVLTVVVLSLTGCAVDPEEPDTDKAASSTSSVDVETDTTIGPRYIPRVTRMDIAEGGGRCAGNLCTINGTTWNCTGGGYCTRIYF